MKKARFYRTLPLISSLLVVFFLLAPAGKYRSVDAASLYLPAQALPAHLQTPAGPITMVWQKDTNEVVSGNDFVHYQTTLAMTAWTTISANKQTFTINQLVLDYFSPLAASWQYTLNNPINYVEGAAQATVTNVRIPFVDQFATRYQFWCVNGDERKCRDWYYWGQYRQYLLRVHVLSSSEVAVESLVPMLNALDRHVRERITSSRYQP